MAYCQLFCMTACAQAIPWFTEKLTTESGLSSNSVNDLIQDDNGFLWIATQDGLNRFDGTEILPFYHSNDTNSLPHNFVYCLKKLPRNYIAIGTQAGLSFYNVNTKTFNNFYYKAAGVLDEFNNNITELETDRTGNLWAASGNCIFIFDTARQLKKVIISPFTEADLVKQRQKFVGKIYPLPDGDVLLCLYDGWHICLKGSYMMSAVKDSSLLKQLLNSISPPFINKYFTPSHLFSVFEKYFICIPPGGDSLFLFDEDGKKLNGCYFAHNSFPKILWSQKIKVIDSSKLLFLSQNNGFAVIPVKWAGNKPVLFPPGDSLLGDQAYNNFLKDSQGNWWLATKEDGLQKISPYKQYFSGQSLTAENSNLPVKFETVSCSRYKNTLWTATYGAGFFESDLITGNQKQHHFYHTSDDTWSNYTWNIRQFNDDSIWVGTQNGMFWYSLSSKKYGRLPPTNGKPQPLDSVPVTLQFTDSHGLVWMGLGKGRGLCNYNTRNRVFAYYPANTANGYPLRYPTNMAETKQGDLWFASDGSTSLVYWQRNKNLFRIISLPQVKEKQIGNLYGICNEGDSVLWLGSITCGLVKFCPQKNTVSVYGHERGLKNSHISSVYEDKNKRVWLITDGGLSCFDPLTESFTNYTSKEGLPVKYPTNFFYYDSAYNKLYAGGQGAYFYFHPDDVMPDPPPQKTIITGIEVNGKPFALSAQTPFSFTAQENDISIHYTAVDLTSGPVTAYVYNLIGGDSIWILAGRQRQINFSHLSAGKYTFMVGVATSNRIISSQAAIIHFSIQPPFTQSVLFYLLLLLATCGLFYFLYRFRLRQLMRTEQIRDEISKNLHDEVGANLTNISLNSLLAQKQLQNANQVSRLLERITQDSQLVSESIRDIVWSINPTIDTLGEALPRMLHYASELLEAKNIELQTEIDPEVEKLKLPMKQRRDLYLIFKEAVNNMAKHSGAGQAAIRFHLRGKKLIMVISDDGIGFSMAAPHISNGLNNMQQRAQRNHWQLLINSVPGKGTSVTLSTV